jgi:tetratricopeptide (TPR) repeat protein
MTFYQLRISIIPILLLSTGSGIVIWTARMGLERDRREQMVAVIRLLDAGVLEESAARSRLRSCATESDLAAWLGAPTRQVRLAAIRALGLVGKSSSAAVLVPMLGSEDRLARDLAEEAIRQARSRSGVPEVDALLEEARRRRAAGKHIEALETLRRCTFLRDEHAEGYFLRGSILLERRDFEGAREAFSQAVERDPTHFDAWLGLGICHHELGKWREARADCLRAVEINPNMEEVCRLVEDFR